MGRRDDSQSLCETLPTMTPIATTPAGIWSLCGDPHRLAISLPRRITGITPTTLDQMGESAMSRQSIPLLCSLPYPPTSATPDL
jgi:hypothetical protein